MTTDAAVQIIEMGLTLLKTLTAGNVQEGVTAAQVLVQLGEKVEEAYQAEIGHPLDPSLIRPES